MPEAKTKEKRIKKEYRRIAKLYEDLAPDERALAEPLLQNSAFMKITLEDLQAAINANGAIDEYQNGENQRGTKASAELNAYNATMKSYINVQRQLTAMLPKKSATADLATDFAELMKN